MTALRRLARLVVPYKPRHVRPVQPLTAIDLDVTQPFPPIGDHHR